MTKSTITNLKIHIKAKTPAQVKQRKPKKYKYVLRAQSHDKSKNIVKLQKSHRP